MMALKSIDLEITPLTLEALLAELESNVEVFLTRGTTPIAYVIAAKTVPKPTERVLGLHQGEGWISDDFTNES